MSTIKDLQRRADELIVQLSLGKAEALDFIEEHKGDLRQAVDRVHSTLVEGSSDGEASGNRLKQRLDELRLQLALGRMEGREGYEEQRRKLHLAIDSASADLEAAEQEAGLQVREKGESLQEKLNALALNLGIAEVVAEGDLETRKEQLKIDLERVSTQLKTASDDASDSLDDLGREAREAFEGIKSNLRSLFR